MMKHLFKLAYGNQCVTLFSNVCICMNSTAGEPVLPFPVLCAAVVLTAKGSGEDQMLFAVLLQSRRSRHERLGHGNRTE